jgi:hypothetical protein
MAIDEYSKKFWKKNVDDNERFREVKFEIRPGKTTPLFTKAGKDLKAGPKIYKEKNKLSIINPKMLLIGDKAMAEVKIVGQKGFIPVSTIKQPTAGNGTQYEDEVVDLINEVITQVGALDIKLKGSPKVYDGILYAVKVNTKIKQAAGLKSDPKCDIILCKDKKKPLANGSIYISHKKAGGAAAFQQYSGISDASGLEISHNRLVKKFVGLVAENLQETDRLEAPIIGYFKDDKLANMSIFGPNFGQAHSLEHVHCIGQGKAKLTPSADKKTFTLDFSDHISLSGDLRLFTGPYVPVLTATYRDDRSFTHNGTVYKKTRLGIYPLKKVFTNNEQTLIYDI